MKSFERTLLVNPEGFYQKALKALMISLKNLQGSQEDKKKTLEEK